jgi:hypothetical protein
MFDLRGRLISREHMIRHLPLLRLTPEQEEQLLALHYPVDYTVVAAAFQSLGIDPDVLVDRMGGSP